MEKDPVYVFWHSEFWTMDKVQKSSNSECHMAASESFRFYMIIKIDALFPAFAV
jgi:hypothetical protein